MARRTRDRRTHRRLARWLGCALAWAQAVPPSFSAEFRVFRKTYLREAAAPETVTDTFSVLNPATTWVLRVVNGSPNDPRTPRISSATISLNGSQVLRPQQFNQTVSRLEVPVMVASSNTLVAQLRSSPGGRVVVEVVGQDQTPPTLAWSLPSDGQVLNTAQIEAQLRLADEIAGLDPSQLAITLNGASARSAFTRLEQPALDAILQASLAVEEGQSILFASVRDLAGQQTTASVSVTVDRTPPTIEDLTPADGTLTRDPRPAIAASFHDALSGIHPSSVALALDGADVTAGAAVSQDAIRFTPAVDLIDGEHTLAVRVADRAANRAIASSRFIVDTTPPAVTSLSPADGSVVDTPRPVIAASFTDALSGVDDASIRLSLDGVDVAAQAQISEQSLSFAPSSDAVDGLHTIHLALADRAGNHIVVQTTFTVQTIRTPPVTPQSGFIHGLVLHALTDEPLPDAVVTLQGVDGEVRAGADGRYLIPTPGAGTFVVTVEKVGFTIWQRKIDVEATRDAALETSFLLPLDSKVTHITPEEGGTATDSLGEVEVIFPPGAVPEPIDVRLTPIHRVQDLPGPLPPNIPPVFMAVDVKPNVVEFQKPALLRFPNRLRIPAGTEIAFGFWRPELFDWEQLGIGQVTADGRFVEVFVRHFCAACGACSFIPPQDAERPDVEDVKGIASGHVQPGAQCPIAGSSTVTLVDGALAIEQALPFIRSLGQPRTLTLTYRSTTADPTAVIGTEYLLENPSRTTERATLIPATTTAIFHIEGRRVQIGFTGSAGALRQAFLWDGRNGRGDLLPTGAYRYRVDLSNDYDNAILASNAFFGGPPLQASTVIIPGRVPLTTSTGGRALLHNQQGSSFGAGWGLKGLQRLGLQPNGDAVISDGDGSISLFQQVETLGQESPLIDRFLEKTFGVVFGRASFGGMAVDASNTIILGWTAQGFGATGVVSKISPSGAMTVLARRDEFGAQATLFITGVAVNQSGEVFVTGLTRPNRIDRILPDGAISLLAESPCLLRLFGVDGQGNLYSTASCPEPAPDLNRTPAIIRFSPSGHELRLLTGGASFIPLGGALDAAGTAHVTAQTAGGVLLGVFRLDSQGVPTQVSSAQAITIAFDREGRLFGMHRGQGTFFEIHPDGAVGQVHGGFRENRVVNLSNATASPDVLPYAIVFDHANRPFAAGERIEQGPTPAVSTFQDLIVFPVVPTKPYATPRGDFSILTAGSDGTSTRRFKDGTTHVFSAEGLCQKTRDRNGHETSYTYDAQDRLVRVTFPGGAAFGLAYDGAGRLSTVIDSAGRPTRCLVDDAGDLRSIMEPDGARHQFIYDGHHRMIVQTDARGATTEYRYDASGRIAETLGPDRETVVEGVLTEQRERRQFIPLESQGVVNLLPQGIGTPEHPASAVLSPTARVIDGRGGTTTLRRDLFPARDFSFGSVPSQIGDSGWREFVTDALGQTTTVLRDRDGNPIFIFAPGRAAPLMTYDGFGNLLKIDFCASCSFGDATRFAYEPQFSQVTAISDRTQTSFVPFVQWQYDTRGNLLRMQGLRPDQPFGLSTLATMTYDASGLLTSVTDALGPAGVPGNHTTAFSYDPATGNLLATTDPLGRTTSLAYDGAGNVIASTDASQRTTAFTYDPLNRLTAVRDATGDTTTYAYDAEGNLARVTDAKGHVTGFAYDALRQLTRVTNPLGQPRQFFYDLSRNLARAIDATGQRIDFAYDAANRLIAKTLVDAFGATQDVVTFAYHPSGDLKLVQDGDSRLDFTYDLEGRVTQAKTGDSLNPSPAQPQTTLSYTYDKKHNRTSLTAQAGSTMAAQLSYLYVSGVPSGNAFIEPLNLVAELRESPTAPLLVRFSYDALGRRVTQTPSNSVLATYQYDHASQLLSLSHRRSGIDVARATYTYDANGNRTGLTDLAGLHAFAYDALNRLRTADHPLASMLLDERFEYDPVGNRTNSHLSTRYVYDAANRLLADDAFTYADDANGNLTSRTEHATGAVTTYTYDVDHQLTRIARPDGMVVTYRYDGLGRRIEQAVGSGLGAQVARYVSDHEDLLLEFDGSNRLIARYLHGPGIDEPLLMDRDPDGDGLFEPEERFSYHADGLGEFRGRAQQDVITGRTRR